MGAKKASLHGRISAMVDRTEEEFTVYRWGLPGISKATCSLRNVTLFKPYCITPYPFIL